LLPDKCCIIHGDATSQSLLEKEGIANCDALVTLTGLDELNMVISLYGNSQGVPQIITKLGRMGSSGIVDDLPLGSLIYPKELCCNTIVRYVRAMQNQAGAAISLHAIADGKMEAVEFLVDETTRNCGVPLKDLKLKPNILLACINHAGNTEIPNGASFFEKGDTVILVTPGRGSLLQLNDIFA
jgi:trk system potassium uptake protein TrkA